MVDDKKISWQSWLMLGGLCLVWGSSFILIKRGLEAFSSEQVGLLRVGIAALAFMPFIFREYKKVAPKDLKYILIVGLAGSGIPSFLYPIAQTHISSSVSGVLNSLTPVFTFILGILFFKSVFKWTNFIGVLIGLSGAVILILFGEDLTGDINIRYSLYAVLATVFYAISVNTIGAHLKHVPPLTINVVAFTMIGIPILIYTATTDVFEVLTTHPKGWESFMYIAILALASTVFSSLVFFKLVQDTNALFASTVAYLIPIVALALGAWDGEVISLFHVVGMAMILGGVYLSKY